MKAFLEALSDCDPEVKKAAIEAVCTTAGDCSKCKTGCETTCCTQEILDKLNDIATGKDEAGCLKEPDADIRRMAAAAARKCPQPRPKTPEEIPAPSPSEIEELVAPPPHEQGNESDATLPDIVKPSEADAASLPARSGIAPIVYTSATTARSEAPITKGYGSGNEQVVVAKRKGKNGETTRSIVNSELLIAARIINARHPLGEVVLELPDTFSIPKNSGMVLVDASGNHQVGSVIESSGRRLLIGFDTELVVGLTSGEHVRIGLIGQD